MLAPNFMGKRLTTQWCQCNKRSAAGGYLGRSTGFTYIGLLMLIVAMSIALTVVVQVWQTTQMRDKEEELLFVGNEFRHAIGMYFVNNARYPHNLEDLLRDPGFPGVRRTLRKMYRDPITGHANWGLVKPDGNSIIGVYSLSDAEPIKQGGFSLVDRSFEAKKKYSEWVFLSKAGRGPGATLAPPAAQDTGSLLAVPAGQGSAGGITPTDSGANPFDAGPLGSGRAGPRLGR